MIRVVKSSERQSLPKMDYNFEQYDYYLDIAPLLTPKFNGNWKILLNDFSLVEVEAILNENIIPEHFDVYMLLGSNKYDKVIKENPKLYVKPKSNWEIYKDMIAGLDVLIDKRAMNDLYSAIGNNINELQEALMMLATKAEDGYITDNLVRQSYNVQNRVYASDVLHAFYMRQDNRWKLANKYVKELGTDYAFYAMRRYIRRLLHDKGAYLKNKDTKLRETKNIDAPFISFAYTTIENSPSPKDLILFFRALDARDLKYVNLMRSSQC